MGRPFKGRGAGIEVGLDAGERDLLVHLLGQLDQLLDDGRSLSDDPLAQLVGFDLRLPDAETTPAPGTAGQDPVGQGPAGQDPALARLLPEANRQDPAAAAEFRRLTETGLRSRKRRNARLAADALSAPATGRVTLGGDEAAALLTALTDLRLVLAERLDLRTEQDADRLHQVLRQRMADPAGGADPWAATAAVYDLLTWWQEALVAALTSRKQRRSQG
jgi:Domain of unknown function (DUF2017)